jgi:SAM-dependent methyltransferase
MTLTYPFPTPPGADAAPVWRETCFAVGQQTARALVYAGGQSGWSGELTDIVEESSSEHHFVAVASRRHAINALRQHLRVSRPTILEVGCSSGFLLSELSAAFPDAQLIGSDYVLSSQVATRVPRVPLLQFDLTQCPLPDSSVDAVVLLHVLEHIEHDDLAAQQLFRVLRPGGVAVIEVPAGPNLFDAYDKYVLHYRRYSIGALTALAEAAGFAIEARTHLGFMLYPAFWTVKKVNRMRRSVDGRAFVANSLKSTDRFSAVGHHVLRFEAWLRSFAYLPVGSACAVVARKPL